MTGPIQPIQSVPNMAVPVSERTAAPAGAPAPGPGPAVELELSALARALENLAKAPELDPRALTKLLGLIQEQGELLRLLGTLAGAEGAAKTEAQQKIGALLETLKGSGAPAGEAAGKNPAMPATQEPAAPTSLAQEVQTRIALSAARLVAAVKGALGPLLENSSAGILPADELQAGSLRYDAASSLQPPVSGLLTQVAAVFRQIAGLGGAENVASGGSDLLTAVTEALRQLQAAGKLAEAPFLRKDFMQATTGIVAALLGETEEASRGAGILPASTTPSAPATPAALPSAAKPQPPASNLQIIRQVMEQFKPFMTVAGLETWTKIEPEIAALTQTANGANPQAGARAADAARRGLVFNIQMLDDPRVAAAAAELNRQGIPAEVIRTGRSRLVTLRVTLPEKGPEKSSGAPPSGGTSSKDPVTDSQKTSDSQKPAVLPDTRPEALRDGFTPLLFAALGQGREAPLGALGDDPYGRARLEQYTHPEAQRFNPQAQQDAAMIQLTAFYTSRREQAVRGARFEPRPEEQALPPRLLLEHKPIIVLRPGQGIAFGEEAPAAENEPADLPVIDVEAVEVRRA